MDLPFIASRYNRSVHVCNHLFLCLVVVFTCAPLNLGTYVTLHLFAYSSFFYPISKKDCPKKVAPRFPFVVVRSQLRLIDGLD